MWKFYYMHIKFQIYKQNKYGLTGEVYKQKM